jgi:group I intron endonuclease
MIKSGIYMIKNILSGKAYIGSSVDIPLRLKAHFTKLSSNSHYNTYLQNAYNKSCDYFVTGVIEYCEEELIRIRDAYYIEYFKADYNIMRVVDGKIRMSEETKNKLSKIKKGKFTEKQRIANKKATSIPKSPETLAKKSLAMYRYNKNLTPERKAEISRKITKSKIGKTNSRESQIKLVRSRGCLPIHVYDNNGVFIKTFDFKREAANFLGCHLSSVEKAINYDWLLLKKYVVKESNTVYSVLPTDQIPVFRDKWGTNIKNKQCLK